MPLHAAADGVKIGLNVPNIRVSFNARLSAEGDSISVDGELSDLTKTDRALTVYLALPVNALGWQWGQIFAIRKPLIHAIIRC